MRTSRAHVLMFMINFEFASSLGWSRWINTQTSYVIFVLSSHMTHTSTQILVDKTSLSRIGARSITSCAIRPNQNYIWSLPYDHHRSDPWCQSRRAAATSLACSTHDAKCRPWTCSGRRRPWSGGGIRLLNQLETGMWVAIFLILVVENDLFSCRSS